jgi:hypothetical protein
MKRLNSMEDTLMSCVQAQLSHLDTVDTEELGQAIDMIKDLEQAKYYCSIVKAMEEAEKDETEAMSHRHSKKRDMDRVYGRMYYEGPDGDVKGRTPRQNRSRDEDWESYPYYPERGREIDIRDSREGRSPVTRRMYMESKQLHKDKAEKVKELEKYMQELSDDIVEMIEGASPEERQVLEKKMTSLTNKIAQLNLNA